MKLSVYVSVIRSREQRVFEELMEQHGSVSSQLSPKAMLINYSIYQQGLRQSWALLSGGHSQEPGKSLRFTRFAYELYILYQIIADEAHTVHLMTLICTRMDYTWTTESRHKFCQPQFWLKVDTICYSKLINQFVLKYQNLSTGVFLVCGKKWL